MLHQAQVSRYWNCLLTLNELNEMLPPVFAEERAGDIHTSVADYFQYCLALSL